jgi:hypothetical protein
MFQQLHPYLEVVPEAWVAQRLWSCVQQPQLWLVTDQLRQDLLAYILTGVAVPHLQDKYIAGV